MYHAPSDESIEKIVVTKETVENDEKPKIFRKSEHSVQKTSR